MNEKVPIKEYIAQRCEFGGADPGPLKPGVMLVFYKDEVAEAVDFLCPCGCGSECYTPVCRPEEEKPNSRVWGFDPATLTITPSIRFLSGCKAHFNITNGRVIMHADSGR